MWARRASSMSWKASRRIGVALADAIAASAPEARTLLTAPGGGGGRTRSSPSRAS